MSHAKVEVETPEEAKQLSDLLEKQGIKALWVDSRVLVEPDMQEVAQWGLDHLRNQ